jgi:DNA-binding MarR family transcriptional regulator
MTPAVRKSLAAISAAPDQTLEFVRIKEAAGLTWRGWSRTLSRLEAWNYVERPPYNGEPRLTITDTGRAAIAALTEKGERS